MNTAASSNVNRQLTHQRRRKNEGDTRVWFWMTPETRASYDRLRLRYVGRQEHMMAAALQALELELERIDELHDERP
jgi:hypothetical protein